MKPYLMYSRVSSVTGKALCEALDWDGGTKAPPKGCLNLVRWGNSYAPDIDVSISALGGRVYNTARGVESVVNRRNMLLLVRDSTPHSLRVTRNSQEFSREDSWIGRHFFGRWGRDIIDTTVPGFRLPTDGYFLVERWPADFEVRVHLMTSPSVVSLAMQIKLRKDDQGDPVYALSPDSNGAIGQLTIRNEDNGWHLYPLSSSQALALGIDKNSIRDTARQCLRGFGLAFGCVDFLVRVPGSPLNGSTPGPVFRVLELNTAPGLRGSTLDAYVNGFRNLINQQPAQPIEGGVLSQRGLVSALNNLRQYPGNSIWANPQNVTASRSTPRARRIS